LGSSWLKHASFSLCSTNLGLPRQIGREKQVDDPFSTASSQRQHVKVLNPRGGLFDIKKKLKTPANMT
jgi:hypothetical protein